MIGRGTETNDAGYDLRHFAGVPAIAAIDRGDNGVASGSNDEIGLNMDSEKARVALNRTTLPSLPVIRAGEYPHRGGGVPLIFCDLDVRHTAVKFSQLVSLAGKRFAAL